MQTTLTIFHQRPLAPLPGESDTEAAASDTTRAAARRWAGRVFSTPVAVCSIAITCIAAMLGLFAVAGSDTYVPIVMRLAAADARDQDDMCVWVDPKNPQRGLIVASDKKADRLFVYDLHGRVQQRVPVTEPGNIDIRQGVQLGNLKLDVIVVNQRTAGPRLLVFLVDPLTRRLSRIDNDAIRTGPNYGGCLFHSPKTGRLYFISTTGHSRIEQYELFAEPAGRISGKLVRAWPVGGRCEAAVADDRTGQVYIAEEKHGIWRIDAEPDAPRPGCMVARVGEHGLTGELEGLALYRGSSGPATLIVSDQNRSRFVAFAVDGFRLLGEFAVSGARNTDGIDVIATPVGKQFPHGLFACHSGQPRCCPVLLARLDEVLLKIEGRRSRIEDRR